MTAANIHARFADVADVVSRSTVGLLVPAEGAIKAGWYIFRPLVIATDLCGRHDLACNYALIVANLLEGLRSLRLRFGDLTVTISEPDMHRRCTRRRRPAGEHVCSAEEDVFRAKVRAVNRDGHTSRNA